MLLDYLSPSSVMEDMERLLKVWIKDQNLWHISIHMLVIQEKAKSFFEDLQQQETFFASQGWSASFKR